MQDNIPSLKKENLGFVGAGNETRSPTSHRVSGLTNNSSSDESSVCGGTGGGGGGSTLAAAEHQLQQQSMVISWSEKLTNHLIDLQSNAIYSGWKSFLLYMGINLYYWYIMIVLPVIPTISSIVQQQQMLDGDSAAKSPYGYYGSWIFRGLAFPLTWGLDLLPYSGFMAVGIIIFILAFLLTCLHLQNYSPSRRVKIHEFLKKLLGITTHVFLLVGPTMMFALTNFTDCRSIEVYDGQSSSFVLSRDSSRECIDGINVIFLVLSCIALVLLQCLSFISGFIYPLFTVNASTYLPFLPQDNLPFSMIIASIGFRIMVSFSIPSNYILGRAIVHIVVGVFSLLVMFVYVPYVRVIENSVVSGMIGGSIGSAVGVLISSFVSPLGNDLSLSLGMLGMTLGVSLIFGVLSSVSMQIYLIITLKRVRVFFKLIDTDVQQVTPLIENTLGSRSVELFFKLSLRKSYQVYFNEDDADLPDFPICCIFAKREAMNKSFSNQGLLFQCATSTSMVTDIHSFSMSLFKKSLKQSTNPFLNYIILTHVKLLESNVSDTLSLKSSLSKLESKRIELKALHKMFFKEFTNELPNNEKIESFVAMTNDVIQYCDQTYAVLLSKGRDKTVLRYYANYVESVKMDKDLASNLLEEANLLEEEGVLRRIKQHKSNKIVPDKKLSFIEEMSQIGGEEDVIGLDMKQASEKRQAIFRSALSIPFQSNWRYICLGLLSCLLIGTLSATLGLGIFNGIRATETDLVIQSCLPMLVPEGLLRYVRMRQIMLELFTNQQYSLPTKGSENRNNIDKYLGFFEKKIATKRDDLLTLIANSRSHRFTDDMYKDYTHHEAVYIPLPSKSGPLTYLDSYMKNISMSEITLEFAKNADHFSRFSTEAFNATSSSVTFMFIFFNRVQAAGAFRSFCQSFQDSETSYIDQKDRDYWSYIIASGSVTCSLILLFSIISRLEMERMSRIIKLFKKIPKDTVGVIYHNLDKNTPDHNSKTGFSSLSKPKNMAIILPILLLIVYATSAGLIYYENATNISNSKDSISSVDDLAVLTRFTIKLSTKLGEMFAYFSVPHGRPVNSAVTWDQVELYRNEVREFATIVQESYDSFIKTYTRGSSGGIVGKYKSIDSIIDGLSSNCTSSMDRNCSLQAMLSNYVVQVTTMAEEYFNPQFSSQVEPTFYKYLSLYNMNEDIIDRVMEILHLLSKYTSTSSKVLSIIAFIVFLVASFSIFYYFQKSIQVYDDEITTIRSLLSYLPIDYLDSNEQLKNFIFFDTFRSVKAIKKEEDENSMNNLLDSMVEGAFLSNDRSEIVLFNKAAQKIFGKTSGDALGSSFYTLFDISNQKYLTETAKSLLESSSSSITQQDGGHCMELECVRKNQNKFPASVNLFVTKYRGSKFMACFIKDITPEKKQHALLAEEKKNSEALLRNILPEVVANRLKSGETFIAERFTDVTCFFSDMVGFTSLSSKMNPSDLVLMLNGIVNGFDDLTDKYSLEKIKTIGDAYFCVGGLHNNSQSDHPERVLRFAIDCLDVIKDHNENYPDSRVNVRLGINTGSVVAGVIGKKKFAYDLWGDTINMASRMESTSIPGRIHISRSTYERVHDLGLEFEERMVEVKGKGNCQTYLLQAKHHVDPLDLFTFVNDKLMSGNEDMGNESRAGGNAELQIIEEGVV